MLDNELPVDEGNDEIIVNEPLVEEPPVEEPPVEEPPVEEPPVEEPPVEEPPVEEPPVEEGNNNFPRYDYNEDMLGNILPVYEYKGASGLQVTFTDEELYVEPYDIEDFKDYAKIDFDTDDNLIELFLKSARQNIEQYLQKSLGIRTISLIALHLPKNFKLPFGPIEAIITEGFNLFGDLLKEGGKYIEIEYETNASLVNDAIIQAIYRQAYHYYENREAEFNPNLVSEVKLLLSPYKRIVFP